MITESFKVFHESVKEMRQAQKDYFQNRTPFTLEKAKKLEKSVDNQILTVQQFINAQN